tara:strand:- start:83 stop:292 length:210 start_codon:yes stop_codon:yes gene_type:complete
MDTERMQIRLIIETHAYLEPKQGTAKILCIQPGRKRITKAATHRLERVLASSAALLLLDLKNGRKKPGR